MSAREPPLQSKRFWAHLLGCVMWSTFFLATLYAQRNGPTLYGCVLLVIELLMPGFMQASYSGGTAESDRFLKLAQMGIDGGVRVQRGDMVVHAPDPASTPPESPEKSPE